QKTGNMQRGSINAKAQRRLKAAAMRNQRRLKNFLSISAAASRESALLVDGRGGSLPGAFLSGRLKLATIVALSETLAAASAVSGVAVSSRRNCRVSGSVVRRDFSCVSA